MAFLVMGLLSRLGYALSFRYRRLMMQNLELAFGTEKTRSERKRIARLCFLNLGYAFAEFCRIPFLSKDNLAEFVQVEHFENAQEALEAGKGLILLSAHLGNWEMSGPSGTLLGLPLTLVVRPMDNPHADAIITRIRMCHGTGIIHKKGAALGAVRALKAGKAVGILLDQRARRGAVVTKFMGHDAPTTMVPALIALSTGARIVPVFCIRVRPGVLKLVFEKAVEMEVTGDRDYDAAINTQRLQDIIERYVRTYPEQWLWPYHRWKPHHRAKPMPQHPMQPSA
jgi:KDO2-lipid IV(A) lauroyltransferase